MALNPNYPVIEEIWGPSWGAAGASLPSTRLVNLVDRTLSSASARRGKQYELDQINAGEYGVTLGSQDGVLDPTNTSGPYGGKILPLQPYRRRAQWPPTANILDAVVATAGEGYTAGTVPASFNMIFPTGAITSTIAVPTAGYAWQGSNVFSFAIPANQGANSNIFKTEAYGIRPGKKLTFSAYMANITPSTTAPVNLFISWLNADGSAVFANGVSVTLNGASGSPAWQRVTVTATAPTTGAVYGMRIGLNVPGSGFGTSAATVYVDGLQAEWASTASTWVSPGTWYPIFSGFTERWPTTWAEGGTYGQVSPTAVDSFALLSQVQLREVFAEEIAAHSPRFNYTMGDATGVTSFADATGNMPSAPLVNAKTGSGNWTSGNAVTAANLATGTFTGSTGTVTTSAPLTPGVNGAPNPATMLALSDAGVKGPASSAWTRMIAFRYTAGSNPADLAYVWNSQTTATPDIHAGQITVYIESTGHLRISTQAVGFITGSTPFNDSQSVTDGNWHLAVFGISGTTMTISLDGVTTTQTISSSQIPPLNSMFDYVGANYMPGTKTANCVYKGDLAFVAEFPSLLSSADMGQLYSTWRTSASGESSAARYARILRYSGYGGASNIGTGLTTSMGPASDIGGADVMSALNNVVTTENGEHFVTADGTVTFRGRGYRYNALTPVWTFGDGTGEYPYEDLQLDFDSTHLSNVVTVTQQSTGTNLVAQDSASIASYYTRTMTRTLNVTSGLECQDAADYFVSRYKDPLTRVQSIKLHPSAAPALWPLLLGLELGTRVRINRRPPGAPLVSVDCFVEQIQWDMDSSNEAFVTLQCSPVDPHVYGQFGAFYTTLNNSPSAGATSITLNAGADNINPLAAQLPAGTQLVVGLGTANQETVTLTAVGVTTSGWTTSACGVSALTKSHAAGETVCEVLPAGVSDPVAFDAPQKFDQVVFAY
jgi:hypothetical protein